MQFYLDLKLTGLTEKQADVATLARVVEALGGQAQGDERPAGFGRENAEEAWMRAEPRVETLKDALRSAPHPALILAAAYLLAEFERDLLPDWVAALAGGNAETWEDLLAVVNAEIRLEDVTA